MYEYFIMVYLFLLKGSLLLDHQTTEGIEPLSSFCLDHLKSLQDNHSGSIESIRILAEKCFLEDYLVRTSDTFEMKLPGQV